MDGTHFKLCESLARAVVLGLGSVFFDVGVEESIQGRLA